MAITRVSGQNAGTVADNTTSITLSYPGDVTSGNLLVVCVAKYDTANDFAVGNISKSAGTATLGSWTLDRSQTRTSASERVAIFSAPCTGTGTCEITVGGAGSGSYLAIALQEFAGADTSASRVDGVNSSSGSGTNASPTTGSVSSTAGAVFVAAESHSQGASGSQTITPDASFSQIYEQEDGWNHQALSAIDRIVTGATSDAGDWTTSGGLVVNWAAALVVYKESSSTNGDVTGVAGTATAAGGVPVVEGLNPGTIYSTVEL